MTAPASSALSLAFLTRDPNALWAHYSQFRVSERLLLTGHSHQAWPDAAEQGVLECFRDAALHVDDKWGRVFAKIERVCDGFRAWLGHDTAPMALAASTHELVVRLLSALDLRARPRIVTTDGEFHSLRRQLDRLAEEGIEVVRVPAEPAATVGARLAEQVDSRTAMVAVSAVFYLSAERAGGLSELAAACHRVGAELLVDTYHALGVLELSLRAEGLDSAFVVGGGYKYLQLGEGNCFLRIPPGCELRPVYTGWFAEYGQLSAAEAHARVPYAEGAARFGGATFEPTSAYRGAAVFDFFDGLGLSPALLREVSQHQVGLLMERFDGACLPPEVVQRSAAPLSERGGFLALRAPDAAAFQAELQRLGVHCDRRAQVLRLGPAPYLSDAQLHRAADIFISVFQGAP
jgi:selenocysteine lyase/cysteine desulfurase